MSTTDKPAYVRKTYYLSAEDAEAIAAIRARHGCDTDSAAVRYALRQIERTERRARKTEKAS